MISLKADGKNTLKRVGIIAAVGILAAALAIAGLSVYAAAKPEPPKSGVWYKDIAASYLGVDLANVYDYTELDKQLPQIAPADRAEFLAVPEEKLAAMTTEELLVTCLDYPSYFEIWAFSSLEQGFGIIYNRYNGLRALLERDDVGEALTAFYSHIDLEQVLSKEKYDPFRLKYLELIIEHAVDNMSADSRRELFEVCREKFTAISEEYGDDYSPIMTIGIAGKILYKESDDLKSFVDGNEDVKGFLGVSDVYTGFISEENYKQLCRMVMEYREG